MKPNRNVKVNLLSFVIVAACTCLTSNSLALLEQPTEEVHRLLLETEELLEEFQFLATLNQLDEAIQHVPASPRLHKKRGDVLMILGHNQEAVTAYHQALDLAPQFLECHWALWALVNRLGLNTEEALQALFHIAELDPHNPLAQLHVARKLRELQRFEESVIYFRRAVTVEPTQFAYRLFLARALFDIREINAALTEVDGVLSQASPNSPVWVTAQNLSQTLHGGTVDMGSRTEFFETIKQPYGQEGKDYKRWALTRGKGWQLMAAGNYGQAESTWREVLILDPEDDLAHYNLGLTQIELGKFEEALTALQASFHHSKHPPFFPDAIFQVGHVLAKLGRWKEAHAQFEHLLTIQDWKEQNFYAINFPDLKNIHAALEEARNQIGDVPQLQAHNNTSMNISPPKSPLEKEIAPNSLSDVSQIILEKGDISLRVLPLSVDVVRGWFRQLITAQSAIQDERQAGFHEYIPLDPGDTFSPNQPSIYLVFALTTPPADARTITTQWVAEKVEGIPPNTIVGTDAVLLELNDNTGYFFLDRPEGGWRVGTYRIDLFVGEKVSPYAHVADVRFRIRSNGLSRK